jgi:recombinational DNA repair protein (RecF pathway)
LIEFIIFQSRTVGKMSKLRTATILKENDWKIENRHSFNVLCNCIKKATYTSKEFFKFFEYALKFISENKYDENVLISIILYRFLILNGINVDEDNAFTQKYRIDLISNNLTNLENAKYNKLKDNVNSTNKFLNEYIFYILGIKVL